MWANPEPLERARIDRLDEVTKSVGETRNNWQESIVTNSGAKTSYDKLIAEYGTSEELEDAVEKACSLLEKANRDLEEENKHAAVLNQAGHWFAEHRDRSELNCPVCAREIGSSDLESAMTKVLDLLQGDNGSIALLQIRIDTAQKAKRLVEEKAGQLAEVSRTLDQSIELVSKSKQEIVDASSGILDRWASIEQLNSDEQKIGDVLKLVTEDDFIDTSQDDSDELLRKILDEAALSIKESTSTLKEASGKVEETRKGITQLGRILDFLKADADLAKLDSTLSSEDLLDATKGIEDAKGYEAVIQFLAEEAGTISENEAKRITNEISAPINKWFSRISHHDVLKGATVTNDIRRAGGTVRNSYQIRATDDSLSNPVAP